VLTALDAMAPLKEALHAEGFDLPEPLRTPTNFRNAPVF
jgi:hypothetical protein